ncbi:MAG: Gas vesicle synthesis GvpLGvpF [Acidobacteriaceae bacterium]|nr:Gas vesicle synthesis GvpLGvpF [Acidobacteriaceae bacterium]
MAILLYCIAKRDVQASNSLIGVAGDPVVRTEIGPLATFTSCNTDSAVWLRPELKASALEFHRVLSEVFKSAAIIPFRFPTIFESAEFLAEHLQERSSEYKALLEKFSDVVQMEIRLTHPGVGTRSGSGMEYLKERQTSVRATERFEIDVRAILSSLVKDWRQRTSKDEIRGFALIDRDQVAEFRNIMLNASVPDGLKVRISGPWPVSEFIEQS